MKAALLVFSCFAPLFGQVVIEESGSTNRPGFSISIRARGNAVVAVSHGATTKMSLPREMREKLMQDLHAASPLKELKVRRCMKSVSFGSSIFVTYKGVRSPDLSCPGQTDPRAAALQKDLQDIISQTHVDSRTRR